MPSRLLIILLLLAGVTSFVNAEERVIPVRTIPSHAAHQAAAADDANVYAIGSAVIAKIDRASGAEIARSTGKVKHLNSGFLWQGMLYCAHSNYPAKPDQSEIMVLNRDTMVLSTSKEFGEGRGSLTWAVREGEAWWCTFAHYGTENSRTCLVKYDLQWKEQGVWTYPPELLAQLGRNSISGGFWKNGQLYVTGHDLPVIYRLRLPTEGTVLQLLKKIPSPFPGQGIALDPVSGGFVGIDRAKKQVIIGELRE